MSDDLDDLSAFEADAPAAAPLMGGSDNDTCVTYLNTRRH